MKTEEYIIEDFNRLNDAFFKYVLASPERKHLTINFINAVLSYQPPEGEVPVVIEDVEFLDREKLPLSETDKTPRFDLYARSIDGRYFHVEVQNVPEKYFTKRSLYYAFSDYTAQLLKGMDYSELKPVVFIGLMNFNLFGNSSDKRDWYTLHKFLDVKTHKNNFEDIAFHMIEVPILRRYLKKIKIVPDSQLEEVLCFWGCKEGDKHMNALVDEIAQKNADVAEMLELERRFRNDPWLVRQYIIDQHAHSEYLANMNAFRKEGEERGLKKGIKKGRKEGIEIGEKRGIAKEREGWVSKIRKIRSQGILSDEQIADTFDMPIEVVKSL